MYTFMYMLFPKWTYKPDHSIRKGCWKAYLNALQLNSNTLFVFDGAVLGLSKLVGQSHILQLQMFHNTNLSHLPSLGEEVKHKCHVNLCLTNAKP